MKKCLAVLLTAAMLLCAAPLVGFAAVDWPELHIGNLFHLSAKAASIVNSGTCGKIDEEKGLDGSQITWTLDSEGLLTISGNGEMMDYGMSSSPWQQNTSVKKIVLQRGVTSIGWGAFYGCTGLTQIDIPNSVTSIGRGVFSDCIKLTRVNIPSNLTYIGKRAFSNCAGLMELTVDTGNPVYYSEGNCIIYKATKTLQFGCKNSIIPSDGSVKCIGRYAFYECTGLAQLTIPESVTIIESDAIPEYTVIYGYIGSYAQQWAADNNRAFVSIDDAAVTLNAPKMVNEPFVNVYGFANPGAEVVCSVNGTATVQAAANGKWSAAIPLTGVKNGDSFEIRVNVTVDGKTAEKTATVTYQPDAIIFREFALNHSCYSVTVKGERLGVSVPNFNLVPGQPLAFKIKVTHYERVDKLFVVSTKDGDSKRMELT